MPSGILIINKPAGWTSHDVVARLRGLFKERRIGHGGTLDPMATGVLPIFVGRATRAVDFAMRGDKEYIAGFRPGIITDTQDITGTVLETRPSDLSISSLKAVLSRFQGDILQLPPMYSAIKRDGKKLYELARRGKTVARDPRPVTISELTYLDRSKTGDYLLQVVCSKGTYIRTLCHDIGTALGCGGAMASLLRTRSSEFTLNQAVTLQAVEEAAARGEAASLLLPVDRCFSAYPPLFAGPDQARLCRNGALVPLEGDPGIYRVYEETTGAFLLLGQLERDENGRGHIRTIKSFYEV
ncbi:MAG: tRNA pseudouridine(55) synthase TruB [Oscillospiraceae bacterium]|nr:tRNA pseudouridine(55) synthase TruB [Oscillospiraceae bacterium]